ncbi:PEP-CTERM sorting domain-containing protein [Iningainema tapete]|uniref:PEP-CTERM sorting domain-containing protein n=1 Tax=Iningainema tapete BLCC-T55 TaxID=2748662 RepID=A0A8J6XCX1_9CYAN|nr:PEP-CTERM sorting domain-containing protein [Iningainema tapete]MBD2773450.1 PEP-CTERM sorting domain-containing protein [Iningainema tapete BLCC-T55]
MIYTDASSEQSGIINGSFETGNFTGWSTIGTSFVDTSEFGNDPSSGNYSALLTTGAAEDGELNVFSDEAIESFLGLVPGSLDSLIVNNAIEGSAIQQTFTAKAGDRLSFDWNFLTNEATPNSDGFNDFAFVLINGEVYKLADTFSSFFSSSANEFDTETGFNTFSYDVTTDSITLGFGVLDTGDKMMGSGLIIDNVKLENSVLGTVSVLDI